MNNPRAHVRRSMNKHWYVHIKEYDAAAKMNYSHTILWVNLSNMTLGEKRWVLEDNIQCDTHFGKVKNNSDGASLVAQWLRIHLPMQGTRVRALVWEDPTCRGTAGPVSHNYWACASGACAPQQERPRQWEARAPRWRVTPARRN